MGSEMCIRDRYSQNINKLEEEISDLLVDKQNAENKYEEEIFLL